MKNWLYYICIYKTTYYYNSISNQNMTVFFIHCSIFYSKISKTIWTTCSTCIYVYVSCVDRSIHFMRGSRIFFPGGGGSEVNGSTRVHINLKKRQGKHSLIIIRQMKCWRLFITIYYFSQWLPVILVDWRVPFLF